MKIIGHPWIECEHFARVDSVEAIQKSPAASILLFEKFSESVDLIRYCHKEGLPFAVRAEGLKSALFAHSLGARYIISKPESAQEIQAVAQHYLFDTEILVSISDESEIEMYAKTGIDGVIFASVIK
jgi:hypothetical protein